MGGTRPEHKKATKWIPLPYVLVRPFADVVKRSRRVADKQRPNLPPKLPNWSRSAFFPVIESFPAYSQFFGECLLSEILPGPIPHQRLRESLAVASERWRIHLTARSVNWQNGSRNHPFRQPPRQALPQSRPLGGSRTAGTTVRLLGNGVVRPLRCTLAVTLRRASGCLAER